MTEVAALSTFNNLDDMVDGFLSGKEGVFANYVVGGDALYASDIMLAKRGVNDAVFLAPTNQLHETLNDTLLTKVISGQRSWKRVSDFSLLLSGNARRRDFREGNFDNINLIAGAYGLEVDISGYELYDKQRDLLNTRNEAEKEVNDRYAQMMAEVAQRFDAEQEKLEASILEAENKVAESFHAAFKAEKEAKAKIANQLLAAKVREANDKWDAGEVMSYAESRMVRGANGIHYRLRKIMYRSKPYVESTGGERTTVTRIMQAYNHVAPIIFGGRNDGNAIAWRDIDGRAGVYYAGSAGSYSVNVHKDTVSLGCQTVSHAELERFGVMMGWPVDGTPATA